MIPIKFRFYRTKKKEMVKEHMGAALDYILSLWEKERHVSKPMLYSSVLDVEKTLIYEGDIVMCNDNPKDTWIVELGEFDVVDLDTLNVVDRCVGFYFKAAHDFDISPFNLPMPLSNLSVKRMNVKVVGNVYEK